MNLDLLKKLTKLANHNPNDNEANSAARRVCKMLEECNFILTQTTSPPTPSTNSAWSGFNPSQAQQNFHRQQSEQARRAQQDVYDAQRRAREASAQWAKTRSPFDDIFSEFTGGQKRAQQSSRPDNPNQQYDKSGRPKPPDPFGSSQLKPMFCSKCKQMKMTSFIGDPVVFICQDCVWS